jgi:hypothetical protein
LTVGGVANLWHDGVLSWGQLRTPPPMTVCHLKLQLRRIVGPPW